MAMVYRSTHRTPHAQGTRCLPHPDKPVPYPWEENAHFAHLHQFVNRGRRGGANKGAALMPINGCLLHTRARVVTTEGHAQGQPADARRETANPAPCPA